MEYVVTFIISDTYAHNLPDRRDASKKLGTELHYRINGQAKAIELANKLIHLTTGNRETVFSPTELKGKVRVTWSNSDYTHHAEIMRYGEWTSTTNAMKKGIKREYPHPYE